MDLKLNNIMLDEYFNIRIGDFGSCLKVDQKGLTSKKRGTQNYMAPELKDLKSSSKSQFNAYKADVYSLGVCLFVLLYKQFPQLRDDLTPEMSNNYNQNVFTISDAKFNR